MADDRNDATSQNNNFIFLNTSEQGINENVENQKFRKKILKTIYLKDLIRKKTVGCRIYTNELNGLFPQEINKICRICIQDDQSSQFISPCKCKGSTEFVHEECLKMWILQQFGVNKILNREVLYCEICKYKLEYRVKFVNRFDFFQFRNQKLATKLCWVIQFIIMALCIYAQITIIQRFGINSLSTISIFIAICLVVLVIIIQFSFSFLSAIKIEMMEKWEFHNYKPSCRILDGQLEMPGNFLKVNLIHCL
ncbi:unnamed protein product (macronuclear) [Paramecium tetraurelia]|uniref:RING-CH-type domain-containing protein n=1 Tax=Paramecium tetraurelia TaxID=5888 RepID=A0C781_PARTE|nr:uncharacterized protein GSPATT00035778001 [Paramecium tetraurelia]CAK66648.1 unnamed protein product [Paramecium tetraurelia]|eukprot:XP_001434045.1 hypothetical protein (macronuclear) [Paramecium tetraurelia strain d4-2]